MSAEYQDTVYVDKTTLASHLFSSTRAQHQDCHRCYMRDCFQPQTRSFFCGLASVTSVLKYLQLQRNPQSKDSKHIPRQFTDQECIYKGYVQNCIDHRYGISLLQLVQIVCNIISDHDLPFAVDYVCTSNYPQLSASFRRDIETFSSSPQQCMLIVNYYRTLGGRSCGHWSPIINAAQYKHTSQTETQWLYVADTASHRIAPHWIQTDALLACMCQRVKLTNLPRGYIVIRPSASASACDSAAAMSSMDRLLLHRNENIYIRVATEADCLTLGKIQVSAWQTAYRGIIGDEFLLHSTSMTIGRKYKHWMDLFASIAKASHNNAVYKYVLVLCENSRVLGYCTVGTPGRSTLRKMLPKLQAYDAEASIDGELFTIYLSNQCPRRKGFGGQLFNAGYSLIRNGFNWQRMIQTHSHSDTSLHMNDHDLKDAKKDGNIVMALWLLGDNEVAMEFYRKYGGVVINDYERAKFGGQVYRYTSMVFGFDGWPQMSK